MFFQQHARDLPPAVQAVRPRLRRRWFCYAAPRLHSPHHYYRQPTPLLHAAHTTITASLVWRMAAQVHPRRVEPDRRDLAHNHQEHQVPRRGHSSPLYTPHNDRPGHSYCRHLGIADGMSIARVLVCWYSKCPPLRCRDRADIEFLAEGTRRLCAPFAPPRASTFSNHDSTFA